MSDEKKDAKDVERKKLTKEILQRQINESQAVIEQSQRIMQQMTDQLQQQIGVLNYAKHLMATFDIGSEPKEPLEVK